MTHQQEIIFDENLSVSTLDFCNYKSMLLSLKQCHVSLKEMMVCLGVFYYNCCPATAAVM